LNDLAKLLAAQRKPAGTTLFDYDLWFRRQVWEKARIIPGQNRHEFRMDDDGYWIQWSA